MNHVLHCVHKASGTWSYFRRRKSRNLCQCSTQFGSLTWTYLCKWRFVERFSHKCVMGGGWCELAICSMCEISRSIYLIQMQKCVWVWVLCSIVALIYRRSTVSEWCKRCTFFQWHPSGQQFRQSRIHCTLTKPTKQTQSNKTIRFRCKYRKNGIFFFICKYKSWPTQNRHIKANISIYKYILFINNSLTSQYALLNWFECFMVCVFSVFFLPYRTTLGVSNEQSAENRMPSMNTYLPPYRCDRIAPGICVSK